MIVALAERKSILTGLAKQRELIRSRPNDANLLNDTAWILATNPNASVRNGAEAVALAERAVELSGGREPAILDTLAAAYAEAGRFAEAAETAQKAIHLAKQQNKPTLAASIKARRQLYEAKTPFRKPSLAPPQLQLDLDASSCDRPKERKFSSAETQFLRIFWQILPGTRRGGFAKMNSGGPRLAV